MEVDIFPLFELVTQFECSSANKKLHCAGPQFSVKQTATGCNYR